MEIFVIAVRSGYIRRYGGSVRYLGISGDGWAITSSLVYGNGLSGLTGYTLDFYVSNVSSSNGPSDRWFGYPIRCLAY